MNARYWDSNAFLGLLKNEKEKVQSLAPILKKAENGELKIITSALTIAEVIYLDKETLPQYEQVEKIQTFFDKSWVIVYNIDRDLAKIASDIVWNRGVAPRDALHVASAYDAKVEYFDTFDDDLIKRAVNYPVKVGRPNVHDQLALE